MKGWLQILIFTLKIYFFCGLKKILKICLIKWIKYLNVLTNGMGLIYQKCLEAGIAIRANGCAWLKSQNNDGVHPFCRFPHRFCAAASCILHWWISIFSRIEVNICRPSSPKVLSWFNNAFNPANLYYYFPLSVGTPNSQTLS